MEKPELWSSMAFARNVILVAVRRGANLEDMCRKTGIDPAQLDQAGAFVSLEQCIKVWDVVVQFTGDEFLGLHMGEVTSPALAGMVGYLMESSPDLLTAFRHVEQFNLALTNMTEYSVDIRGEEFLYFIESVPAWQNLSPGTARQVADHSISAFVHMTKLLTGKTMYPTRVQMRGPRPRETGEYLRILHTEPLFGQDCNCLTYKLRDMQAPLIGHNPQLNSMFRELLEKEIAKTRQAESFANEVRRVVLQNFNTTLPQLTDVVGLLHTTPRTLQRKLKEEGASFQSISDSVKSELAIGLLKNRSLTINEIAYKLGYSEPSVFRRAFKKWTGTNPKRFESGSQNFT